MRISQLKKLRHAGMMQSYPLIANARAEEREVLPRSARIWGVNLANVRIAENCSFGLTTCLVFS
jgi:hypothetical protein